VIQPTAAGEQAVISPNAKDKKDTSGEGAAIPTTSGNRAVGPSAAGDGAVNRPASSAQEPVPLSGVSSHVLARTDSIVQHLVKHSSLFQAEMFYRIDD